MCEWGTYKEVLVKIPADLSSTGREKWKSEKIDACIADIVEAMQKAGIDMRGSCCGHNKTNGHIDLQDGRVLLVLQGRDASRYYRAQEIFFLKMCVKQFKWIFIKYPFRRLRDIMRSIRKNVI